jgi:REP element-mobilizing transposase RayT
MKTKHNQVPQGTIERKGTKFMAHSYVSIFIHYIFSTKNREETISPEIQDRLWSYMGGVARENKMKALAIGGTEDHAHVLLSLPAALSISRSIQLVKGVSSTWASKTFPDFQDFNWQSGYGGFSISVSHIEDTIKYINNQKEHHRHKTFQEEYLAFLKKHHIDYDERYIWG